MSFLTLPYEITRMNTIILLFLSSFAIYLYTLFPSVAIYRDAGEMASVTFTLGIAHPPGYPLYVILGKLFSLLIPFGNIAYRINIMSAFFGALTCGIFYLAVKDLNNKSNIEKNTDFIFELIPSTDRVGIPWENIRANYKNHGIITKGNSFELFAE